MATNARLKRDISDVMKLNTEAIGIAVCINENLNEFDAFLKGPDGSPYAKGHFKVHVSIPEQYPLRPPTVTFLTKIWHPNISSKTGYIRLDILSTRWAGSMNLRSVLLSVQNLLLNYEKDDAQDVLVGRQACRDEQMFIKTAQQWTNFYAGGVTCHEDLENNLKSLVDMGYETETALYALSSCDWSIEEAIDRIENAHEEEAL